MAALLLDDIVLELGAELTDDPSIWADEQDRAVTSMDTLERCFILTAMISFVILVGLTVELAVTPDPVPARVLHALTILHSDGTTDTARSTASPRS